MCTIHATGNDSVRTVYESITMFLRLSKTLHIIGLTVTLKTLYNVIMQCIIFIYSCGTL